MPVPESGLRLAARLLTAAALVLLGPVSPAQQPDAARLALCMSCHGPQGISQVPLTPSLAGQPKLFIENQLVLIREGLRDVPPMKGLLDGMQDAEIVALAGYFSAQPAPAVTGTPNREAWLRGQELSSRMHCASCHLPDYSGRQQIPRLAGQQEAFLLYAMKQFRDHSGPGRDTIMSASLYGLKDADLADLAHYMAHFK